MDIDADIASSAAGRPLAPLPSPLTPRGASHSAGLASQRGGSGSETGGTTVGAATASSAATPLPFQARGSVVENPRRRRGPDNVTRMACVECRKKRAKCDGGRPCNRCKNQDSECIYETPVRESKENLRRKIDQLRRQQDNSEKIFSALVRPDLWEEVLSRLRSGQTIDSISEWLGDAMLPSMGGGMSNSRLSSIVSMGSMGQDPGSFAPSAHQGSYATGGGGGHSMSAPSSSVSSQYAQALKHDSDQSSPWGGPFASQPVSAGEEPQMDMMSTAWTGVGTLESTRNQRHQQPAPPQHHQQQLPQNMQQMQGHEVPSWIESAVGSNAEAVPDMLVPPGTWTTVTGDPQLVQHLLTLYFCWEYPTFASLSKEHFLKDFQEGRPRFCSSLLVNALLALGCRFSSHPSTLANQNDPYTSGDHFFQECQRLYYQEEDHHTLTTIQALGIMSIREASCGRDSESWYYAGQSVRLATEMGLYRLSNIDADDESAVQAATFWGAFALDHAWSLATGTLPQCSWYPRLPPKPAIIDDIEASLWVPYTDDGTHFQRSCEQPSNVRSVYKCFCELSELVHHSLYVLHTPGKPLTSRELLDIYTQYLNWYDRIPEVLRLGHNFTPAVLFAHMYYHFAILLLFRPLIKLRIIGSSVLPRDVCFQAAGAIQGLLRSYSQLYTLRRTPSFVPYFVLTSAIMHLAIGASSGSTAGAGTGPGTEVGTLTGQESGLPATGTQRQDSTGEDITLGPSSSSLSLSSSSSQSKSQAQAEAKVKVQTEEQQRLMQMDPIVSEAVSRSIADLVEMAPCHHFAEQALNILRYLAKKWNLDVNIDPTLERRGGGGGSGPRPGPGPGPGSASASGSGGGAGSSGAGATRQDSGELYDNDHLTRPTTSSLNFFAPNVSESDYVCSWGQGARAAMDADAPQVSSTLENPLFWLFPMQGRPILPAANKLPEAGFELLR